MTEPSLFDDRTEPPRLLVAVALDEQLELTALDRRIVAQALWLAERCGAHLRFAHVIEWLDPDAIDFATRREQAVASVEVTLGELCSQTRARGVESSGVVAAGRAWHELLHEAWHWPADLIVLGPRVSGDDFVGRLVHGSTARRLVRKAPMPVWVVGPAGPPGIRRMLVAVDLSPISAPLVRLANRLHELAGVERVLLHCLEFPNDIALNMRAGAHELIEAYHQELTDEAMQQIDALLGTSRPQWEVVLGAAWVVRVVPRAVEQHDCDLVVVASMQQQAPSIAGKLLGTTAEKILEHLDVSTWIARPQA